MKSLSKLLPPILQKSFRMKDEFIWFASGQVMYLATNFLIVKAISNIGKDEFGVYVLILTVSSLLTQILYGPAQQSLVRYYYIAKSEAKTIGLTRLLFKFLNSLSGLLLIAGIVGTIICSVLSLVYYRNLFFLSAFFIIGSKYSDFFSAALNTIRQRKLNALLQISERGTIIILLVILYYAHAMSLFAVLFLSSLSYIVFGLVKKYRFKKSVIAESENQNSGSQESAYDYKPILRYAAPFSIWGTGGWLQQNSEKWIMADLLAIDKVGVYGLMITVINTLLAVPNNLLNDFTAPLIFKNFADLSDKNAVRRGNRFIFWNNMIVLGIAVVAVLAAMGFGALLLRIFGNSSYTTYSYLLPYFAGGTGLFLFGQSMCNRGLAMNQPNVYLFPKLLIGIISVILNYTFIKYAGIQGMAYASLLTGAIYLIHISLINRRFRE